MGWHGVERETGGGHSSFYLLHLGSGKSPSHQTSKQENTHSRRVALASSVLRGVEYSRPRPHWGWSHSPCVYGAWESAAFAPPPGKDLFIMDLPVCSSKHFLTPTSLILSSVQGK